MRKGWGNKIESTVNWGFQALICLDKLNLFDESYFLRPFFGPFLVCNTGKNVERFARNTPKGNNQS